MRDMAIWRPRALKMWSQDWEERGDRDGNKEKAKKRSNLIRQ